MSTALTTVPESVSINDTLLLCTHLAKSGYFADARDADKALVKVLAGREYGFSPIASLVGVHIIEGKPSLGANLIASMIKRSGKYDYKLIECSRERCEIDFLESGQSVGPHISMTLKEAVDTGLAIGQGGKLKSNWSRHSDDMLFARCIAKGFRRYCPDLSGGLVTYSQDEIGSDEQPVVSTPTAEPPTQPGEVIDASYTVNGNTVVDPGSTDFITKEIYDRELAPIMPTGYVAKLRPILGIERWGEAPLVWLPLLKEICTKIREPLEFQALYLGGKSLKDCDQLKLGLALLQLQNQEGQKP